MREGVRKWGAIVRCECGEKVGCESRVRKWSKSEVREG